MKRHWPSAKIVSKAREDFPDPEPPVTTVSRSCGSASETLFRLFCRAPWIRSHEDCAMPSNPLRCDCTASRAAPARAAANLLEGLFRDSASVVEEFSDRFAGP